VTPEDLALVEATFAAVLPQSQALAASFYKRLFATSPELRPLFPANMGLQHQKLADELAAIVEAISDVDRLLQRTGSLGQRHRAHGVKPSHYRLVGDALLGALGDELGEAWTAETARAWSLAYRLVAEAMQLTTPVS
jgi:nitric oxide dioxygenase